MRTCSLVAKVGYSEEDITKVALPIRGLHPPSAVSDVVEQDDEGDNDEDDEADDDEEDKEGEPTEKCG